MARKDPYDPEEGIIDLFDIVDDPEASPEPEPRGALHDEGGQALPGQPEKAEPESPPREEGERVVSRYPFENSDDFLEEIEKTPLMTLLPPKGGASALPEEPVSDGAGEEAPAENQPVREEPDEALIRAFEAEMAKAGAVVHEYGVETAPGMADASGGPDGTEAPSADAAGPECAEPSVGAQGAPAPEPAERTYAEDLELLSGDAPAADAPQVEPSPVASGPALEAPMPVSPKGGRAWKLTPPPPGRPRPRRKGLLGSRRKPCPLPHQWMKLPGRCRKFPRTARIGRLPSCPSPCRTFPSVPPCRKRSLAPAGMEWKNVLSGWRKP